MNSARRRADRKNNSMKEKKLSKLINEKSESDNESEHELSHYINDRVKLIKEVLKIIKPKKIRSMAPQFMRNMDNEEINSMLLEELLGISNKRLKYIFNGQNLEEDSSSTDPEEDQKPIDVISLDDISDDALEDVIDLDSDKESRRRHCRKHRQKIKEEPRRKKVKKERQDKPDKDQSEKEKTDKADNPVNEQNLMSVLELLELQARARAIRSQLALESSKKQEEERRKVKEKEETVQNDDDDEDDVIIELPKNEEIVITSSDSENEDDKKKKDETENNVDNFWKGQKPTNGSFYANSECTAEDPGTTQNNAEEDNTEQSSDKGKDIENSYNAKTRTSDGRKAVIIQQVEIIRPADSTENIDSDHLKNIPLPADEDKETSSKKDDKNPEETTREHKTVDNENLEGVSKVDKVVDDGTTNMDTEAERKGKEQTNNTASSRNRKDNVNVEDNLLTRCEQISNDENVNNTVQNNDAKNDNECNLKQDSNMKDVCSKKSRVDNIGEIDSEKNAKSQKNEIGSEDTINVDILGKCKQLPIDASTKDKTKEDNEANITTSKKKLKCSNIENENLEKAEETGKNKKPVLETSEKVTDSNKTDDLVSEKTRQGKRCTSKDGNSTKKSEHNQESKAKSDSKSQSSENQKSDITLKKTKGKCKRRMAAVKAGQRTSNDETTGDYSKLCEEKQSSKKQKSDRNSIDDDKNNTDDSEGIVLHYDQADIECIILD